MGAVRSVCTDAVDAPCLASLIFDFSGGASFGRVLDLRLWPSMTPGAGMLFG